MDKKGRLQDPWAELGSYSEVAADLEQQWEAFEEERLDFEKKRLEYEASFWWKG